jgi:hypothetical protein
MADRSHTLPAGIGHNGGPDLTGDDPVDFEVWFNATVRKPNGQPYGKRARQAFVKKFRLPIIALGWARMIVPSAGNARIAALAKFQQPEPAKRGRGRPRAA